jgi:hypothetical protein
MTTVSAATDKTAYTQEQDDKNLEKSFVSDPPNTSWSFALTP